MFNVNNVPCPYCCVSNDLTERVGIARDPEMKLRSHECVECGKKFDVRVTIEPLRGAAPKD